MEQSLVSVEGPIALPSPSDFHAYARAAQQWPLLSETQEQALVAAWREQGNRDAARALVLSHLRLVVSVVRDHRGYGLPEGDLAQEGTVGLMRAVHRFDPAVGVRLAAYAIRWIEAEIREFIFRNWRMVRLGSASAMKKLFFGYRQTVGALRTLHADRPAGVSAEEVAEAMGLSAGQVEVARAYFQGRDVALDAPSPSEEEGQSQALMLEVLHDGGPNPESAAEEVSTRRAVQAAVRQALDRLPERDREVLRARRLTLPPLGLTELAARWGVSAERIRQIEVRAAKTLEAHLRSAGAGELLA